MIYNLREPLIKKTVGKACYVLGETVIKGRECQAVHHVNMSLWRHSHTSCLLFSLFLSFKYSSSIISSLIFISQPFFSLSYSFFPYFLLFLLEFLLLLLFYHYFSHFLLFFFLFPFIVFLILPS